MPIKIDYDVCVGCQTCVNVCKNHVYDWSQEEEAPIMAREEECIQCFECIWNCPQDAISIIYTHQSIV